MSYYRGGGGRRRYNNNRGEETPRHHIQHKFSNANLWLDDYEEERRRAEALETPENKLKSTIIKFGDVVSVSNILMFFFVNQQLPAGYHTRDAKACRIYTNSKHCRNKCRGRSISLGVCLPHMRYAHY